MEYKKHTTDYYIDLLNTQEYFTYGKFGDGELIAIFKYLNWIQPNQFGNSNCDGHLYYNDMGEELHNTFINEKNYFKASPNHWIKNTNNISELFKRYINEYNIEIPNLHDTDTAFYKDAVLGNLTKLKTQLEKMNYIIVGDSTKRNLPIKYVDFVEIPRTNAWLQKDRIKGEILEMVDKYNSPVFGMSAGMGTLAIQDDLYPIIGDKSWMISFGSIFDPFLNMSTRSYHKNYKNTKL
jgi:hypothetical protein